MRGHNPEWDNLPRRKCDDCGKSYKPKQPLKPDQRGFCTANCRKSYHKHGGAYRKLKVEIEKLVARRMLELKAELLTRVYDVVRTEEPCDCCAGRGIITLGNTGPKQYGQPCPKCTNGAVLTVFGREVLDFVNRRALNRPAIPPVSNPAPLSNHSAR